MYLRELMPGLVEHGHKVAMLHELPPSEDAPTIDDPAMGVERWCVGDEPLTALRDATAWRPDVAYVQGLISGKLERAIAQRVPSVFFAHGYYGTCATGAKRHTLPSLSMCERRFGPACLALNYVRRCGGLDPLTLVRRYRREVDRSQLFPEFRSVVVASTHMVAEFRRNGVPAERLHKIPLPAAPLMPPAGPPVRRPVGGRLVWLGRATALKGGDHVIEALPEAARRLGRPLSLTIAGEGPAIGGWRALAARRGVAAEFLGWIDSERRLELMRSADLLAVPSLWPEPFGLVGIEAGGLGLPAVAYDVGGIPEWLRPGETGELAPGDPPTTSGLTDAIVRALEDPAHHALLRQGAWDMAQQFSMEQHLKALLPILAAA
jgi:glycosyltransferase involved in cell wall biosynthesis